MPRASAGIGASSERQYRGWCLGRTSTKRLGPIDAGRLNGWKGVPGSPVAALPSSPPVLRARLYATTLSDDTRLIIVNLHVAGAWRPLSGVPGSGSDERFFS